MKDRQIEELDRYYALWLESSQLYEKWAKMQGLSFNSVMVLCSIYEAPEQCTQKTISQKWHITKQTVNMILKDFEKRGLVEFVPLQTDKRNKLIKPTAFGKEYASTIVSELHKMELFIIAEMGIDRMAELNNRMAQFLELFKERLDGKKDV